MHPNYVGALLNSAIYLACVFFAGIVVGDPLAWKLALAAMGVTYLSHILQLPAPSGRHLPMSIMFLAVIASVVLGIAAGVALLF